MIPIRKLDILCPIALGSFKSLEVTKNFLFHWLKSRIVLVFLLFEWETAHSFQIAKIAILYVSQLWIFVIF